jgi:hypothetical protein
MTKTLKLKELQRQYEFICNEYVRKFCNKQGMQPSFWVANLVGDIVCIDEYYFFNFSDIVLDINSKQPKGAILEWYDDNEAQRSEGKGIINYYSYALGLRVKDLED